MAIKAVLFDILLFYKEGKETFEKMDLALLKAKSRWDRFVDYLLYDEKGASDIVAIMVVIVILLAVAAVFRTQLMGLVESVFDKATTWVEEN